MDQHLFATIYITESVKDDFKACTVFENYHYQEATSMYDKIVLVGLLMLWLKRCVIPTPREAVAIEVIYPVVRLTSGHPLSLLSSMVCRLQSGLRELVKFCNV